MRKLGIIAGGGVLPRRVAEAHVAAGGEVFVIAFEGQTEAETVAGREHAWVRLGATDATLKLMRAAGVEDVVMAGPMRRPTFSEMNLDLRSVKALARVGARAFGDDGLLSAVIAEIEGEGFRVRGIEDVLGGYLAPAGRIAGPDPDPAAPDDIRRGLAVLAALAPVDVGQTVAVQEGLVLAVEAVEGTDSMIERAGAVRREGAAGPVLVKVMKVRQERRADLPTIGPDTVEGCRRAGFRGIALQAGSALLIDRREVMRAAGEAGIFVVGIDVITGSWS